jgi:acyl carrier protein
LCHLERSFSIEFSMADLELDTFRSIERIARFVQDHGGA